MDIFFNSEIPGLDAANTGITVLDNSAGIRDAGIAIPNYTVCRDYDVKSGH